MSQAAPDARRLRSDARRNRERIVASARAIFAARGVEVPVDEITRDAGVGMGTLYRHFPTKADLVDAVLEDAYEEFFALAEAAVAADDAFAGLRTFLEQGLAMHAANRGFKDLVASGRHERARAEALRRRLRPVLGRLVERAKAQGSLRSDFSGEDVLVLLRAGGGVIDRASPPEPETWRRYLALVVDGLRAERPPADR